MAMNDEIREQRKKLKGKGIKAHLAWFWEYEKIPTIVVLAAAAIVISLIYHYMTYKPYAFGTLFLNASIQDDQQETLAADFLNYAGLDSSKEDVFADLMESLTPGDNTSSQYDIYSVQKIMAETAAKQIDTAVMDAWYFRQYAYNGEFLDLTTVLDSETLAKYEGRIFYIDQAEAERQQEANDTVSTEDSEAANAEDYDEQSQKSQEEAESWESLDGFELPDPEQMEKPVAVGIWCNDASYIQENGNYDHTACIFGIVANTEHPEICKLFLEYLYEK